jgi:hypothetical protein
VIRSLGALVLASCWTASTPPATPVAPAPEPQVAVTAHRTHAYRSPCEVAVDHVFEVSHDELGALTDFAGRLDSLRSAAIESCNEQHWTTEMLDCLNALADSGGLGACQARLTTDQTSDLMRRLTEILTQQQPQP